MEHNYYLKDGLMYKISGSSMYRVTVEDIYADANKVGLLIDDAYFFYVGMEHVATSAKKLKAIAVNYLNILFPSDIISSHGVYQSTSKTIIYLINNDLLEIINNNQELFAGFKKISTPFIELVNKYNDFIYFDGTKKYKLTNNMVTLAEDKEMEFITSKDLLDNLESIKTSINLPGVIKKSAFNMPILIPAVVLGVIYIMFIISYVFEINSYNKVNKYYEEALLKVYTNLGVASSKDPYGSLLQQAKSITGGSSSQKVISVFNDLNDAAINGITFDGINIRDNDIRITGTATDFAQVESVKKVMENKLQNNINIDDTKKNKNGITFTMKYQKDNK